MLAQEGYAFVQLSQLSIAAAERLAAENYSESARSVGPYPPVSLELNVFRIMQDGVDNTVNINRVTRTSYRYKAKEGNCRRSMKKREYWHKEQKRRTLGPLVNRQYVVIRIIHHPETRTGAAYFVEWYVYIYIKNGDNTETA